jgi:hypothetical protein
MLSINAKDEHFPNEAFDTIRQFNLSYSDTLFKVTCKPVASLLVIHLRILDTCGNDDYFTALTTTSELSK